jgi:DNA-binding MarR family transcriptional regulator
MRRASGLVMADLASALGALGLKISEASVLIVIEENPGRSQSEIGRRLGIQRANMAPLIGSLEQRDLLVRSQAGGRSSGLTLSPSGEALARQVRQLIQDHEERMFGALDQDERRALARLLKRLWA